MIRKFSASLALASIAACAPVTVQQQAPPPHVRPVPYPVFETPGFRRAVEKGTRTRSGAPGPRYWQQWSEYRLSAKLDTRSAIMSGSGTIRYFNRSPDRLDSVAVHLSQNLHSPGAVRNRFVPVTGGVTLARVGVGGVDYQPFSGADTAAVAPGTYRVRGTIAWIRLRDALVPASSVTLEFDWSFPVPPVGAPRMGQDGEVFHLAYWYPQMAVYDDVNGWHTDQYMSTSEFYLGFGDYDVSIEVPERWLIAATGTLTNADAMLSPTVRDRLRQARSSDGIVRVLGVEERDAGHGTVSGAGRSVTWKFTARNVRDFAWTTSNRYIWDATRALVRRGDGGTDTVAVNALYRPGVRAWDRVAEYVRHSVEYLSRFLWPYPYPHMTAVQGLISGGMEFPMLTLVGGSQDSVALHAVLFHEVAHVWFPMQVASDERRHPWMDEGLTRFNQTFGRMDFFPKVNAESIYVKSYLDSARTGRETESMRYGDLFPQGTYRLATYEKPAVSLLMLREILGDSLFMRAYREYGRRWQYRHPQPFDFFNAFNDVSGQNLDWFWRTWFFETWTLDQAIASVVRSGDELVVTIEDRGLAPMPVLLAIQREGSRVETVRIPVDVWLAGARRHSIRVKSAGSVTRIDIDPENRFADVDRSNQIWVRSESGRP